MATTTTRLVLRKPDPTPGTGDLVSAMLDLNANWDKVDAAVGAVSCTSGARPASPYNGQLARETDTGNLILYNGTTWRRVLFDGPQDRWPTSVEATRTNNSDTAFSARFGSDTQNRIVIQADGTIFLGNGVAAQDTVLFRAGPNLLKTDDFFHCMTPLCRLRNNAVVQNISTSSTTKVQYDVEDEDNLTNMGDVANDRMVVRVAGVYVVGLSVGFASNSTNSREAWLETGGNRYCYAASQGSAGNVTVVSKTTIRRFAVNDIIEHYVWQNSGSSLGIYNGFDATSVWAQFISL